MCTMLAKKAPIDISSARGYQQELDNLYARRIQIDSIIESLEEYERLRSARLERTRRTA